MGWYQIKNSLKQYKGGKQQDAYSAMLEEPYKALTVKLADAIYHFGFYAKVDYNRKIDPRHVA